MASVLIVDDEPRIAGFVQRGLRPLGIEVAAATEGRQGLERILGEQFDVVLLDLMMPGIDGINILRRTLAAIPDQRIIVLSAIGDVQSKVRCLELGAVDYLAKPFDLEELAARVKVHLRARRIETGAIRRFGRIQLDLERRSADVGTGHVALTAREFDVLRMLIDSHGAIRSRADLLAGVWHGSRTDGNVVEACVRRLRAKLGADVVETVSHEGYRVARA